LVRFAEFLNPVRERLQTVFAGQNISAPLRFFDSQGFSQEARRTFLWCLWRHGRAPQQSALLAEARRLCDSENTRFTEQALLIEASLVSIERLPGMPIPESVARFTAADYDFFAAPPPHWLFQLNFEEYSFHAYAGVAILKRFPAGIFSWEVSGFPRSWFFRVSLRDALALAARFAGLGGFSPFLFPHMTVDRRSVRFMTLPEVRRAFLRIAWTLAHSPKLKGILANSWLYSTETARVSPHLAFLRALVLDNGGCLCDLGAAPASAGFLAGDARRAELYEQGEYHPRNTMVLWPREAVLSWAASQPRFDNP